MFSDPFANDQYNCSRSVCGVNDTEVRNNKSGPDIYLVRPISSIPTVSTHHRNQSKSVYIRVVFEDSIRGISGAITTGMTTVLINNTTVQELSGIADKIPLIVDSLENFRPESVGLPPYQRLNIYFSLIII